VLMTMTWRATFAVDPGLGRPATPSARRPATGDRRGGAAAADPQQTPGGGEPAVGGPFSAEDTYRPCRARVAPADWANQGAGTSDPNGLIADRPEVRQAGGHREHAVVVDRR